jgi:hypothetical protein
MKRALVCLLAVVCLVQVVLAVDGKKAMYVGGTVSSLVVKAEYKLDTSNETNLILSLDRKGYEPFTIPYATIDGLEYGQKAGRRVAVGILISPLALFSKKRNHYFTISFKDDAGKDQAAVLELGKDIVRTTLTIVETRSGKKIEYQDEEARKAGKGSLP